MAKKQKLFTKLQKSYTIKWLKSLNKIGVFGEMIKKIKSLYVVLSERTGRIFGRYHARKDAQKRLRQIEFFKYVKNKGEKTKK